MNKEKKNKAQLIKDICEWVLVSLAIIFVLFVAVFASNKPTEKQSGSVFGFETRLIVTGSMEAEKSYYYEHDYKINRIEAGSVVFIKRIPDESIYKVDNLSDIRYTVKFKEYLEKINVGDVVCFIPESGNVNAITHRVVKKYEVNNKIRFETRGDVVDSEGATATESFYAENLVGKVIGKSMFVGNLYTKVFKNKIIMASLIFIPSIIVIGVESNKIVKIIREDREEKAKELENKQ